MFADLCDTEARKNWKMGHKVNPIFYVFILLSTILNTLIASSHVSSQDY